MHSRADHVCHAFIRAPPPSGSRRAGDRRGGLARTAARLPVPARARRLPRARRTLAAPRTHPLPATGGELRQGRPPRRRHPARTPPGGADTTRTGLRQAVSPPLPAPCPGSRRGEPERARRHEFPFPQTRPAVLAQLFLCAAAVKRMSAAAIVFADVPGREQHCSGGKPPNARVHAVLAGPGLFSLFAAQLHRGAGSPAAVACREPAGGPHHRTTGESWQAGPLTATTTRERGGVLACAGGVCAPLSAACSSRRRYPVLACCSADVPDQGQQCWRCSSLACSRPAGRCW